MHRNIYALIAKHLSLLPSTFSVSLCVSSLSLILFSIFVILHWALISFSHLFFPPFTRPEQSNKKWPKHKRTKDKWVGMKTGKAKRGERGMRREKRSERVFGVTGHPGQARFCKCLQGNINWIALLISYFTCFHTAGFSWGQMCVFICRNAFIFKHTFLMVGTTHKVGYLDIPLITLAYRPAAYKLKSQQILTKVEDALKERLGRR